MKFLKIVRFFLSIIILFLSIKTNAQQRLIELVDPFIGTGGHGHTYPGATLPFGMVQLSPDTGIEGWDWCSGYHYSDVSIIGFSHTHLSGTGISDYADILLMPTVGKVKLIPGSKEKPDEGYRSRFNHKNEKAHPGFYSVYLDDYKIQVELTATERCGFHKYIFPKTDEANIILDLDHGLDSENESMLKIIDNNKVEGLRKSRGWAKEQYIYFYMEFSKPFESYGIENNNKVINSNEVSGKNVKGFFRFRTNDGEEILVKVGISSVSLNGARNNLEHEIPHFNFDLIKKNAERTWEKELSKIIVEGGTAEQKKIFYTALYHTMITPNIFSDVDGKYLGMDKKIDTANNFNYYTVFSLWDTFRAEHPLLSLIDRKRTKDFIHTFLDMYNKGGLLPVWELASNETWTMIGYHSIPVIFDAYMKGIRDFDLYTALQAMKKSAEQDHHGLKLYKERGFIPADKENESVSKTLEYSYDDWCIAQFAKELKLKNDFKTYNYRSQFYKNLFDTTAGFFRGKFFSGQWIEPFIPNEVNAIYTEATAWQYNFFAPHDIKSLISLHGGNEKFIKKIDEMFLESPILEGRHQPDISGMIGQYAHGNEPSHHIAYLYNYANAPWKTQEKVRLIMDSLYTSKPDGLCGNDDCGQLSAWYVFSALGFYPVCPGQNTYVIGSPIFEKAVINLENGNQFIVTAKNVSHKNIYINSAKLNGNLFSSAYLTHDQIMNGGILEFEMSNVPNKNWGSEISGLFQLAPEQTEISMPQISATSEIFYEPIDIFISCETPNAKVRYTLDGSEPNFNSYLYKEPIKINNTTTLKTFAYLDENIFSSVTTLHFTKSKFPPANYKWNFNYRYSGGGEMALTDGRKGTTNFQNGEWQGFEGVDLEAIINLEQSKSITNLSLTTLNDPNVWIFAPRKVEFYFSNDGINFSKANEILNDLPVKTEDVLIKTFSSKFSNVDTRYIKVIAESIKVCPEWHKGNGNKCWIFIDELVIE